MNKKLFLDLISFKAFKPDLSDPQHSLQTRCGTKSIALVNYGAQSCGIARAQLGKTPLVSEFKSFKRQADHVLTPEMLEHLAHCSPEKLIAVSWGLNVHCGLHEEERPKASADVREHTIGNSGKVLRVGTRSTDIVSFEQFLKAQGFAVLRIQLTVFNLLNRLLKAASVPIACEKQVVLVLDQGFLTGLARKQEGDAWLRLRHRCYADPIEIEELMKDLLQGTFQEETDFLFWETAGAHGTLEELKQQSEFLKGLDFRKFESLSEHLELEALAHG